MAAINIGSSAGAFDRNPAFDFTTAAENPEELVKSVAEVYQRFLGKRKVQTGRVQGGGVEVEVDALVREAFLVVAADGPVSRLEPGPGNPNASALHALAPDAGGSAFRASPRTPPGCCFKRTP